MENNDWSHDPPSEPGLYWLYGDASFGSMGGDYTGEFQPEKELNYVKVRKISNGLMAQNNGRIISLKPFDKERRREGFVGVWRKVELPKLPKTE